MRQPLDVLKVGSLPQVATFDSTRLEIWCAVAQRAAVPDRLMTPFKSARSRELCGLSHSWRIARQKKAGFRGSPPHGQRLHLLLDGRAHYIVRQGRRDLRKHAHDYDG